MRLRSSPRQHRLAVHHLNAGFGMAEELLILRGGLQGGRDSSLRDKPKEIRVAGTVRQGGKRVIKMLQSLL
jgi:hypothetical protein